MLCRTLFRSSHDVLLTLQHENSDFPSKTTKSWKWNCSFCYYEHRASSCISRCHTSNINLIYRVDYLFGTVTLLYRTLPKDKTYLDTIVDLTHDLKFSSVLEWKYFSLNINILDCIQVYFIKYEYKKTFLLQMWQCSEYTSK